MYKRQVITRPLYKAVQARLDRVLGLTRENLTGVRVVRAFDKEKTEVDRFEDANELLTKMQLHVGHISALMNPLTYVIINPVSYTHLCIKISME